MYNVVLSPIGTEELINRIAEQTVKLLQEQTDAQQRTENTPDQEDLLTREEAMRYLRITGATLWRWEKEGKIQSIGIGGKRYFRKSEIDERLTKKKGGNND